jgi:predicted ATP-binding protein involved in virulence
MNNNFYIEKIILHNRAPFKHLELCFEDNKIAILSAINGGGKTTILSHIVDAWVEITKPHFQNEYAGKENKFYRLSSGIHNLDMNKPSFVYIRFKYDYKDEENNDKSIIDYVDVRNNCIEQEYNDAITIDDKIPFNKFQNQLKQENCIKKTSANLNKEIVEKIFNNNVVTYFPSYRFEQPGFLNAPYKIDLKFSTTGAFSGYLPNPLEVVSGLPQLANWMMDVVLDWQVNTHKEEQRIWNNLNTILNKIIQKKGLNNLCFGVGARNRAGTRIAIATNKGQVVYPTIFNVSSGEAAVLCVFGEILRQADKLRNNIQLQNIRGIVLIDEVDKHLHIKLQKEVLPQLFGLLPNVQFIISSHSPFVTMGLAENKATKSRVEIYDLDQNGLKIQPQENELYKEVYGMMISENENYKEMYDAIKKTNKPIVFTEGKTDPIIIATAWNKIKQEEMPFDVKSMSESNGSGAKALNELLRKLPTANHKVIGLFDSDKIGMEQYKGLTTGFTTIGTFKKKDDNIFALCLPVPESKEAKKENFEIED